MYKKEFKVLILFSIYKKILVFSVSLVIDVDWNHIFLAMQPRSSNKDQPVKSIYQLMKEYWSQRWFRVFKCPLDFKCFKVIAFRDKYELNLLELGDNILLHYGDGGLLWSREGKSNRRMSEYLLILLWEAR